MVKWIYKLSLKVLCVYSEPLFKRSQEASKLQQKNKGSG